jgi:hypothetical protein
MLPSAEEARVYRNTQADIEDMQTDIEAAETGAIFPRLGKMPFGEGRHGPVESIFPEGTIRVPEEGPDFQRMRVCKFFL